MDIKELTEENYHYLVDWNKEKDQDFLWQWAGNTAYEFPISEKQIAARIAEGCRVYLVTEKNIPVGTFEVDVNETKNQIFISRVLFEEQMRGKGFGTEALATMIEQLFQNDKLHRAVLHVYAFNVSAMHCYEKIGFRVTQYHQVEDSKWNSYTMEYKNKIYK